MEGGPVFPELLTNSKKKKKQIREIKGSWQPFSGGDKSWSPVPTKGQESLLGHPHSGWGLWRAPILGIRVTQMLIVSQRDWIPPSNHVWNWIIVNVPAASWGKAQIFPGGRYQIGSQITPTTYYIQPTTCHILVIWTSIKNTKHPWDKTQENKPKKARENRSKLWGAPPRNWVIRTRLIKKNLLLFWRVLGIYQRKNSILNPKY